MGTIATTLSEITIITSDNPRSEDPLAIIGEVQEGVVAGKTVYVEPDRRKAIAQGLGLAQSGDVVLIAGKGHETYQVIGSVMEHLMTGKKWKNTSRAGNGTERCRSEQIEEGWLTEDRRARSENFHRRFHGFPQYKDR
jgi:hypothetical protein